MTNTTNEKELREKLTQLNEYEFTCVTEPSKSTVLMVSSIEHHG